MTQLLDIVGIGSMAVDRIHRCERILGADEKGMLTEIPDQGPVQRCVGGVVLNHLGWAATLGLKVGIFGRQADDEGGRFLRAAMDHLGIERDIAIEPATEGEASTVAEIFVDDLGQRTIYMARGTTAGTTAAQIRERHAPFIRRARLLSTEISQLPLPAVLAALEIAAEAGIASIVDLDIPPSEAIRSLGDQATLDRILARASIIKPSKVAVAEFCGSERDPLVIARRLRARFGNRAVVVTDGEAGCGISADDYEGCIPGAPAKVVDTTGAGDAFLGGLLAGLHHELEWEQIGRLANACGAACTEQLGAFPEQPERARARVLELFPGELRLEPTQVRSDTPERVGAGRRILDNATREVANLSARHDGAALEAAADLIDRAQASGGRVHVTGVGKAQHVAHYGASLFSSTGIPATFLHTTEALHGSLGQVVAGDVVIAISNSGETRELLNLVSSLDGVGARSIAVTGSPGSSLARAADSVLDAAVDDEGGPLGLAPRASVVNQLLVLAALGGVLQERRGFTKEDYALRHPAGKLGERARR